MPYHLRRRNPHRRPYCPAEDSRWPVLLHRTPYDRTDSFQHSGIVADPVWLARQGFTVLVQDTRGRFESGGEFDFITQEYNDSYDVIDWAAAQRVRHQQRAGCRRVHHPGGRRADGFALNVSEGAQRARYRNGGDRDWLDPEEPSRVKVTLHDVAHRFGRGHRIRVQIAGFSFLRYSRNLHTRTVPEFGTLDEDARLKLSGQSP